MEQAKQVASGFIATASAICLLVTFSKMTTYLNLWVGSLLLLVLVAPFFGACFFKAKAFGKKQFTQTRVKQVKKHHNGYTGRRIGLLVF